ncbi:LysR family transcriptional regulator [Nocardia huaxiensis]|uniref:LysR family transcriptional regulator n=1 Tax=Nocardia huaxiensis TaxID=2755382 RepID=A0A7D6VD62_9NOCA|nr:LysR family transcriptional regulator [Nocardia huaxiensis]QLY30077.1 LysR family transcriptional regulator [Nocardia huaxiensis]UFS96318.1 LysR family transcriptional regulator [Nocardia huaxiensis]
MELRDIEIFLTLAEELHFGRTAERLHVSPARISQAIKKQERNVGTDLFERTSRTVRLTPVGEQLRDDLRPVYRSLHQSIARARMTAQGKTSVLRIGMVSLNGYELRPFWEAFRARYPQWGLQIRHNNFIDPFGPVRRGEIDALVAWLPIEEPDLTTGPVLFSEGRVLQVSADHPLAEEKWVSGEAIGDYPTTTAAGFVPDYWEHAFQPSRTPSGRQVERLVSIGNIEDILTAVGSGEAVHPIGMHVSRFAVRPDIVRLPIADNSRLHWGLVWRSDAEDERIRGLANVIRELGIMEL